MFGRKKKQNMDEISVVTSNDNFTGQTQATPDNPHEVLESLSNFHLMAQNSFREGVSELMKEKQTEAGDAEQGGQGEEEFDPTEIEETFKLPHSIIKEIVRVGQGRHKSIHQNSKSSSFHSFFFSHLSDDILEPIGTQEFASMMVETEKRNKALAKCFETCSNLTPNLKINCHIRNKLDGKVIAEFIWHNPLSVRTIDFSGTRASRLHKTKK